MLPSEATENALEVLGEEETRPTVDYSDTGTGAPMTPSRLGHTSPEHMNLYTQRGKHARHVFANPKRYKFHSINYELLLTIYGQVDPVNRVEFITSLAQLIPKGVSRGVDDPRFPTWDREMSYLPLLMEFCVRTGHTNAVLEALDKTVNPSPGIVVLLAQLGEMISLNFNLFSRHELEEVPKRLENLKREAARVSAPNPLGLSAASLGILPRVGSEEAEILGLLSGIHQECKQARYHYLSGSFQELPNLEIEADRRRVEHFLVSLGFSTAIVNALNQVELEYTAASTLFNLKNCLGHLRSVVEHLHLEACRTIASATPGLVAQTQFGDALVFLRKNGFLSCQEESLVGGLYRVISDKGVHPLFAEREYARLLRNMTIEYGLMFLTILEKKGVRIN